MPATIRLLPTLRSLAIPLMLFGVLSASGCGPANNPNSFENVRDRIQSAEQSLQSAGVQFKEKSYPGMGVAKSVDLTKATLNENTVQELASIGSISELHAAKTAVDDAFLQQLVELELHSYLNVVDLSETSVTDAGIQPLAKSRFLQQLNVKGSRVTDEGVAAFKKARSAAEGIPAMTKTVKITK